MPVKLLNKYILQNMRTTVRMKCCYAYHNKAERVRLDYAPSVHLSQPWCSVTILNTKTSIHPSNFLPVFAWMSFNLSLYLLGTMNEFCSIIALWNFVHTRYGHIIFTHFREISTELKKKNELKIEFTNSTMLNFANLFRLSIENSHLNKALDYHVSVYIGDLGMEAVGWVVLTEWGYWSLSHSLAGIIVMTGMR